MDNQKQNNEDRFDKAQPAIKAAATNKKETTLSSQKSSVSGILSGLAFVGAIAALGGVGYLWQQTSKEKADLVDSNSALAMQVTEQNSEITALEQAVNSLKGELKAAEGYVAIVQKESAVVGGRMNALEGQIAELTGFNRVDWMLKEVEHFIMVAERRLSLLGDVDGALALMVEADQLVRDMAEPGARDLRGALQADLLALNKAADTSVDTEGLFSKISLLSAQVPELRSAAVSYERRLPVQEQQEPVPTDTIDYVLYEVVRFMKSLVQVQRVSDGEIKPLLLQDQQVFVEQNVKLLLEQAQMALLRGDQVVYSASLKEAANRVRTYLNFNNSKVEAFVGDLASLSGQVVDPDVPSVESSVRAVKVFRDYWQKEKLERQLGRLAIERSLKQGEPVVAPVAAPVVAPVVVAPAPAVANPVAPTPEVDAQPEPVAPASADAQ